MNSAPERKIIITGDGSHSLEIESMDETYHSRHGALIEAKYVFIEKGIAHTLNSISSSQLNILEVGFGTGLNALVTMIFSEKSEIPVHFTTIEPFPVPSVLFRQLNYGALTLRPNQFVELHLCDWDKDVRFTSKFTLHKIYNKLESAPLKNEFFHCVYFDAFAPSKQAEIWSDENLKKCFDALTPGGFLVTYCAQGAFKRGLKAVGFEVETLEGPPGKKEMVRAKKPN